MSAESKPPPPTADEKDIERGVAMAPVLCAAMKLAGLTDVQAFICLDALFPVLLFLVTGTLDEGPFATGFNAHVQNVQHFRRLLDNPTAKAMLQTGFSAAATNSERLKELFQQYVKPDGATVN